jgi:UDP-N-acetylmuramate: L-alanyl-gamma-D-glutamyl-meso-diaminopimelate ligase
VILGTVHRATQLADEQRLDPESIATAVRQLGKDARVLPSADVIADLLTSEAKAGDLLLVMSNGSFDGLCEKVLQRLSASHPASKVPAQ